MLVLKNFAKRLSLGKMYSNAELWWKIDYEGGLDYLIDQISPDDVEHERLQELLYNIKPIYDEIQQIVGSFEEEAYDQEDEFG